MTFVSWTELETDSITRCFSYQIFEYLVCVPEFFYLLDDLSLFVFEFLSVEPVLAFLASDGLVEGSPPSQATKLITVEVVPKQ
jgi:hypothetical protein